MTVKSLNTHFMNFSLTGMNVFTLFSCFNSQNSNQSTIIEFKRETCSRSEIYVALAERILYTVQRILVDIDLQPTRMQYTMHCNKKRKIRKIALKQISKSGT